MKNKENEREELFEKYGIKTTNVKKQGVVVIIKGTPIIEIEALTKEQLDNMTNEEKINRALKIAENYPQTALSSNLKKAEEYGKMWLVDKILMNPNMTISEAMATSYAIVTD